MAKPNYAFEKRQKEIAKKKKKEEKRQRKSADNDQVAHDVSATTGEGSTPSTPPATE
jgi:hypothetical protein